MAERAAGFDEGSMEPYIIWMILAAIVILGAAAAAALLRSAYERRHFTVTVYELSNEKIPEAFEGFCIAVLADLHGNSFGEGNGELIQAITAQRPDIIVIAGDAMVVKNPAHKNLEPLRELCAALSQKYPVYYGKGNHEARMQENPDMYPGWYEELLTLLREYRICYLENSSVLLSRGEAAIRMTGFDVPAEYYHKKFRPLPMPVEEITGEVGESDPDHYQILLAHSPIYAKTYAKWGSDLTISGHFHGGTIRLPVFGGLMSPQFQFFSGLDRGCYAMGENRYQVTSGGLGTHSINIRLNNMSELVVLHLHTKPRNRS